jgi:hypothetical protein
MQKGMGCEECVGISKGILNMASQANIFSPG